MGQFGDKLMSKSGDKLVTVFTAIINMLDMTLRLIDKLEANPITKKNVRHWETGGTGIFGLCARCNRVSDRKLLACGYALRRVVK